MAARDIEAKKKRSASASIALAESDASDSTPSPATTIPSSPASFDGDHRTFSLSSLKGRAWRSFTSKERDSTPDSVASFRGHARKLSKSRPLSSCQLEVPSRRGSFVSDHRLSMSTADSLSLSAISTPPPLFIDWRSQKIEGAAPLESETHRSKPKYLVVTADYLVKVKSASDPLPLLQRLAAEGARRESNSSVPETLLAIPITSIVSVFVAESTRPSFGLEVWWKSPMSGQPFCRSDFFFSQPNQRNDQMHGILRAMRAIQQEDSGAARQCRDVEGMLNRIHKAEESKFYQRPPEFFPVVPRGNTRKELMPKLEDATKKPQEGSAFYLLVGTYACHLVEIQKGKAGDLFSQHKTYWLATLESLQGEWMLHEERFNITFREPFRPPVTLELASRYFRQIIHAFGMADRYIKPAWPQLWQTMEIFHIPGLKELQYLVPRDDFGSFKRTLDAYLAAYRCDPVDWEINWKTRFAPEFRLLPAKRGPYTPLQILAVLRALRYNDYFNALSFKDVDLSVLHGLEDMTFGKPNVAYLSRTCVALGTEEIEVLRDSPLLHQEFHALTFCSETIRQIDFTNCTKALPSRLAWRGGHIRSLQFLGPILNLLKSGITKCNRLILAGNPLPRADIENLAETMAAGAIQTLDVSYCGLDDSSLREIIVEPLSGCPSFLEGLSVSGNPGRLPAHVLPEMLKHLTEIRDLDLGGTIQGDTWIDGPLLPYAALESLQMLETLDISGYKVNDETLLDLEQFLKYRRWMLEQGQAPKLRKLVLNRCGITGTQAAILFDAIGENRGMHLCLSGNPIEDGIEHLAGAIRRHRGPAGLDMEMVEFRDESNYLVFIKALTESKHLSALSLAGTAPSPSSHGPCSQELVATLHDFFARNTSIRWLDLSGFCGKLDDSQLAKGFGRSLSGLASNKTMTHLHVRNQNLHEDAGTLGRVLAENDTLRMVDCRGNNLNLTSLRFLVDSLKANRSIVEFPLPPEERRAIWKNILDGLQRTPLSTTASSSTTTTTTTTKATTARAAASAAAPPHTADPGNPATRDLLREEERLLREVLDTQLAALDAHLAANRARLGLGTPPPISSSRPDEEAEAGFSRWSRPPPGDYHHQHQRDGRLGSDGPSIVVSQPGYEGGEFWRGFGADEGGGENGMILEEARDRDAPFLAAAAGSGWMRSPAETLYPVTEVSTPLEKDETKCQLRFQGGGEGAEEDEEESELLREVMEGLRGAGLTV